jgi:superfamily II DNA or RNA helicase
MTPSRTMEEFVILPEGDYNFTVTDSSAGTSPEAPRCRLQQGDADPAGQDRQRYRHRPYRPHPQPRRGMALSAFFRSSVRRSTASVSSWTGTGRGLAAAELISSRAIIPTGTATSVRRTMSTASMTTTRRTSPRGRVDEARPEDQESSFRSIKEVPMFQLRPYQAEAKQAILAAWDEGYRKTLLVLPTGCGKTVVFLRSQKIR